jgi:hypothetical protein
MRRVDPPIYKVSLLPIAPAFLSLADGGFRKFCGVFLAMNF